MWLLIVGKLAARHALGLLCVGDFSARLKIVCWLVRVSRFFIAHKMSVREGICLPLPEEETFSQNLGSCTVNNTQASAFTVCAFLPYKSLA